MRGSGILNFIALIFALLMIASVGGAFAVWIYSGETVNPVQDSARLELSEFVWAPEEILPETPGSNYLDLLDSILNNNKGGLNSSKGTLENAVNKDVIVHSSQNVQGGNLKHLFITQASNLLDFIVQYVSDTEFHVYMFETEDANRGTVGQTQIKVYKTILVEIDGEWIGQESQLGYAVLREVRDTDYIAVSPDEWVIGRLPT